MPKTITYSEKNKGWTSFFDFYPGLLCNLNNRFFSVKEGQLYLHNDKDNSTRNNFYGEQFNSKIKTVLNEAPSQDKVFKNLILEGDHSWSADLKTNYSGSTIEKSEFNAIESRHFAYLRKNEDETDLNGGSAVGVGVIQSITGSNITFTGISNAINIGDNLYQINGSENELIGEIIDNANGILTIDTFTTTPVNGYFCFAKKDSRIEGGEIRGYYMEVELENTDTEAVELFAIESTAIKSYV
ncbi:structural protein [Cellulophaga phage phi13:2]|uniref:Structural protein n=1 Tax=Cellulophaga phage phi13:2 TaxID=1328030 RepID=S0A2T8_9CAUD|nr:structural protein [Cellulophaga phage phi13:2]AGO49731.1 structural protein [Cellulophaga phage phi13:2]